MMIMFDKKWRVCMICDTLIFGNTYRAIASQVKVHEQIPFSIGRLR